MKRKKYTFEMCVNVTEQTTVKATCFEEAEAMVFHDDCEWEEVKSQGGEIIMISEEEIL